jgi:hypothetical protein
VLETELISPIHFMVKALGYGLEDRGSKVRFPAGAGNFSLHHRVQTGCWAHQHRIKWVPGALFPRVKQPGPEADHSPPPSAEVKNAWSYTSTHQYVFIPWCLAKHSDYHRVLQENVIMRVRKFWAEMYIAMAARTVTIPTRNQTPCPASSEPLHRLSYRSRIQL